MWFVGLGCILVLLKWAELTIVASWSWWIVLAPFGAAAIWWWIADATGYTKAREAEREDRRVSARRERHLENLGLSFKGRGTPTGKPRVPPDQGRK